LVVDDEDSIRVLIRHTLGQDYDVTLCESGREALDLLASREFDLVLCDLRLRDVSGREVYAWVRNNRRNLQDRFMVITGDTHGEESRSFLDEFGTPCLTKPFDLDDLATRVRECLGGGGSA
ncbi:MAG: response regulator, partial [Planctomycetes bacterium]|nr:response regulator [Planctomycetota bacterium]